jgi:hypothetical protein
MKIVPKITPASLKGLGMVNGPVAKITLIMAAKPSNGVI